MREVLVVWQKGPVRGTVDVVNGTFAGSGHGARREFALSLRRTCRLRLTFRESMVSPGAHATLVTVCTRRHGFSFFLRDVKRDTPIVIPEYGVAIVPADDTRTYEEILNAVRAKDLLSESKRIGLEPEESFACAAAHVRSQHCETWLGLSRDIRIFSVDLDPRGRFTGFLVPRYHGTVSKLPEAGDAGVEYRFVLGRGAGCVVDLRRHLDQGVLPILHGTVRDCDVFYKAILFVSLEHSPLTAATLRGTHFLAADGNGAGHMFTPDQQKQFESIQRREMWEREEETVLYCRVDAVNYAPVPRYAFFKTVFPASAPRGYQFNSATGSSAYASGRVFAVSRVNGRPLPQEEMAILLPPGGSACFEFAVPHQPLPPGRAQRLARWDFDRRLEECRAFWRRKLRRGAQVSLPELRVQEMVQAGLLHLDLVAYGLEPRDTIAPAIGVYCPIGSESAPIIQFFDSMGWHDVARRALQYFLDKQHEDGFMQNFGGYMLETGAVLWSMGEHYRYTRDDAWVRRIAPKLLKACDYLLNWRRRNQRVALRGKGYGLIEGKVADPEDPYHSFMLNGYAYLGVKRASEMLASIAPAKSRVLARAAAAWRRDIRAALAQAMARSPVVPLGDGTWCPTAPPWAESRGPVALYTEGGKWYTHGTFTGRDSLLGPHYLILQEVLDPREPMADFIVRSHQELFCLRNVAFSQPYYSRHDFAHLRRGEVKAFLKTYYNAFAGLADRETYTFWEHYFGASPHKTHEEGWFLMQTRWMLYLEEGDTLKLLPGVPRAWLVPGNHIRLQRVATYFGPVSLEVEASKSVIRATVECHSPRRPAIIELRLPHPEERRPTRVTGGRYLPETETLRISGLRGRGGVSLHF